MSDQIIGGAWGFSGKMPESNLQAEFYHHCRLLQIPCLLEYSTPTGRHDISIFTHGFTHLIAIVECKNHAVNPHSRQIQKYKQLGVPIYTLISIIEAPLLAAQILRSHFLSKTTNPVPIDDIKFTHNTFKRVKKHRRKNLIYMELDPDLIIRS